MKIYWLIGLFIVTTERYWNTGSRWLKCDDTITI